MVDVNNLGKQTVTNIVFGIGGFCDNCSDAHDHPLHNIVEKVEVMIEVSE